LGENREEKVRPASRKEGDRMQNSGFSIQHAEVATERVVGKRGQREELQELQEFRSCRIRERSFLSKNS
jgi:CRISPR/Cas system-associated endoribonuclease Cas2